MNNIFDAFCIFLVYFSIFPSQRCSVFILKYKASNGEGGGLQGQTPIFLAQIFSRGFYVIFTKKNEYQVKTKVAKGETLNGGVGVI